MYTCSTTNVATLALTLPSKSPTMESACSIVGKFNVDLGAVESYGFANFGRVAPAGDCAPTLLALLADPMGPLANGGVLYFPNRGSPYVFSSAPAGYPSDPTYQTTLMILSNITLMFAPGAIISLVGVVMMIWGPIRAGLFQVFDLVTASPESSPSLAVLAGTRIPEVFPEWWGAGILRDDTAALQAAFDSAHNIRQFTGLQTIPICLTGTYKIRDALQLGGKFAWSRFFRNGDGFINLSPFHLRGSSTSVGPNPQPATLTALRGFRSGRPMLHATQSYGFRLVGVSFDGAGHADGCLLLDGGPSAEGPTGTGAAQSNRIAHCTFHGATNYLVHVGQLLLRNYENPDDAAVGSLPVVNSPLSLGGEDLSLCCFDRCQFVPAVSLATPHVMGLVIRAGQSLPVEVRHCLFRGQALAMIRAFVTTLLVRGCAFQNTFNPSAAPETDPLTGQPYPNGADIYIDFDPPFVDSNGNVSYSGYCGLAAIDCQSRSLQFLATYDSTEKVLRTAVADSTVTLIGIHHFNPQPSSTTDPPVVAWRYPRLLGEPNGAIGGLTMWGCHFDGQILVGSEPITGPITDLGTTFRTSPPTPHWTGSGTTDDVYSFPTST